MLWLSACASLGSPDTGSCFYMQTSNALCCWNSANLVWAVWELGACSVAPANNVSQAVTSAQHCDCSHSYGRVPPVGCSDACYDSSIQEGPSEQLLPAA